MISLRDSEETRSGYRGPRCGARPASRNMCSGKIANGQRETRKLDKRNLRWKGLREQSESCEHKERNRQSADDQAVYPAIDIEALVEAAGTPWNAKQQHLVSPKPTRRILPTRGIEPIGNVPLPLPEQETEKPKPSVGK